MKNNLWRIIWIVGIYAVLISILLLVITYKVKWEDRDLNTYLYFYNCSNNLCTTTVKQDNYYTNLVCDHNVCPYIVATNNDIVTLKKEDKMWLYDYKNGIITNDEFLEYRLTDEKFYIVRNEFELEGIIKPDGEKIVDLTYQKIYDFRDNYIAYQIDDKMSIDKIQDDEKVVNVINQEYDKLLLVNKYYYAYIDQDGYHFVGYDPNGSANNNVYDYVYPVNKFVFVVKNGQIDILDENLNTKLLMKLDSYYSYKIEKERATLNIYEKDNLIHFSVFSHDDNGLDTYTNYTYDIRNGKLYS